MRKRPQRAINRGICCAYSCLKEVTMSITEVSNDTSFSDLGREMWSYLTGNEATIDYSFMDMTVEVPKTTGADSDRATWKLNGTLRITTSDKHNPGSIKASSDTPSAS